MTTELQAAIKKGRLNRDQLKELVRDRARALDMNLKQARTAVRRGNLPPTLVASDLDSLVRMLERSEARAKSRTVSRRTR